MSTEYEISQSDLSPVVGSGKKGAIVGGSAAASSGLAYGLIAVSTVSGVGGIVLLGAAAGTAIGWSVGELF